MAPDFFFTYHPFRAELVKQASGSAPPIDASPRAEVEGIMQRIYDENPSYWPYGISPDMLDGGAYLVRDALTKQAFGFAGWQERDEGARKIGYYAIGVLPEFRGSGIAKQAVSQLILQKSAGVDEVRAFIVPSNVGSLALAKSLGVAVRHKAASAAIRETVLPMLGGGLANSALWDSVNRQAAPFTGDWDSHRTTEALINGALFGAPAGFMGAKGFREIGTNPYAGNLIAGAAGTMGLTPAKDLLMRGNQLAGDAQKALQRAGAPATTGMTGRDMAVGAGAAAGLGGLGYLLYKGLKGLQRPKNTGHVTIKLPRPDGTFTEVQMPMEQLVDLPENVVDSLGRDVKRRLREESRLRTYRRSRSGRLVPLVHDEELVEKPASVAPPPTPSAAPVQPSAPAGAGRTGQGLPGMGGPVTTFTNFAQNVREKHDQRVAAEDQAKGQQMQMQQQNQQVQQQQAHEMAQTKMQVDAKAQSAPAAATIVPGSQISPATSFMAKSVMKTIGRLKVATEIAPPKTAAPAPAAPAGGIAAKYAPEQQKLQAAGYKVHPTSGGIVGVNNAGNRVFIDQLGRKTHYQMPVTGQASDYTWDAMKDWAHGAAGSTAVTPAGVGAAPGSGLAMRAVNADLGGWNPLKGIARWGEDRLRAGARTTMGMMDMQDALGKKGPGAGDEFWDASKRTLGAFSNNAGNILGAIGGASFLPGAGGTLTGVTGSLGRLLPNAGGWGTAARMGAGALVPMAAGAASGLDEERPYDITGSTDERLAAALGERAKAAPRNPNLPGAGRSQDFGDADFNATMQNMGYGALPSATAMNADNRAPFTNRPGISGLIANILGGVAQNYAFGSADQNAFR